MSGQTTRNTTKSPHAHRGKAELLRVLAHRERMIDDLLALAKSARKYTKAIGNYHPTKCDLIAHSDGECTCGQRELAARIKGAL